jgi:hypothetical protein
MRKVSTLVGLALFALAGTARAQGEAPVAAPPADPAAPPAAQWAPAPAAPAEAAPASGRLIIGADAAFQLPLGTLADATGIGFGALARGEFKIIPHLNLTARTGFIYSLSKNNFSVYNVPFWVGAKYFLTDMFYGAAEIGENYMIIKTDYAFLGSSSFSGSYFGATVGAGALIGQLDVRAQLEVLDFSSAGDFLALMINVGYNFANLM